MGKLLQFEAALRKNYLHKRRNLRATFCEAVSPLFLVWLLYYGYGKSDVFSFAAQNYAQQSVYLPGAATFLLGALSADGNGTDAADTSLSEHEHGSTSTDTARMTAEGGSDLDALFQLRYTLDRFLRGPLPAPSFDQFVLASNAISSRIAPGVYDQIIGDTDYGRAFGNLVTLGTFHVAPAGPDADAFIRFANTTTSTFGGSYFRHRVHDSEEDAVRWIDKHAAEERAWVLVVFNTMEVGNVDYTLRFNYTTLPHTGYLVNFISLGLNDFYQRYYFSGFHSVSRLVDDFAFDYTASNAARQRVSALRAIASNVNSTAAESASALAELLAVGSGAAGSSGTCAPPTWIGVPFPTPEYSQNLFYLAVGYLLGLVLTMATLYPVSRLIKDLVEEKETRMRETMAAMGMDLTINAAAAWCTSAAMFSFQAAIISLIAKASFFPRSEFILIFLYFELLFLSEIGLGFLVSSCFSRARLASILGPVALFAACLPRYIFFGTNRYESTLGKKFASLSSVAAFCFGADVFADYEYAEIGVGWNNYDEGDYSLQTSLVFMALDSFLYLVLAAYIDAVAPTQHGSPRHPLFFLAPLGPPLLALLASAGSADSAITRWLKEQMDPSPAAGENPCITTSSAFEGEERRDEEHVSWVDMGGPSVRVTNLVKDYHASHGAIEGTVRFISLCCQQAAVIFIEVVTSLVTQRIPSFQCEASQAKKRTKRAVDGLNLDLWAGQVTCLLGHNGAGKSTTVSVLTGLTPPTEGDCIVMGHSLVRDLASIRRTLGVCPQNNVVFASLTVAEHLDFFAKVKGIPGGAKARAVAVTAVIEDVGLSEKRHVAAQRLSGGQKRKLCLAMALIGDPKVVFLDEPTSGMDPYSRRATWDLIRRAKKGRVVVLTTHFMDEADVLGDRVAILSHGKLRCVGSPLWLKARFGIGYLLSITTMDYSAQPVAVASDTSRGGASSVRDSVARLVPSAEFVSEIARDLSFRLPRLSAPVFPALLDFLEADDAVEAFGLSVTTLEEVFIRIAEEDDRKSSAEDVDGAEFLDDEGIELPQRSIPSEVSAESDPDTALQLRDLTIREEVAVHMWKRLVIFHRDSKGAFFQIILPLLLVASILAILTIEIQPAGPSLRGLPSVYRKLTTSAVTLISNNNSFCDAIERGLKQDVQDSTPWIDGLVTPSDAPEIGRTSYNLSEYLLKTYNEVGSCNELYSFLICTYVSLLMHSVKSLTNARARVCVCFKSGLRGSEPTFATIISQQQFKLIG